MYVPKPGQLCTIWHVGVSLPVVPGWIFGVRWGGGGVKISLITNFVSILMILSE